jgi:hypothetical protein
MNIRSFIPAALVLASLPLAGCSGDDDDDATNTVASPLAGHTYVLTTNDANWSEPRGIAGDVENVMPHFLFQVTGTGGSNVSVRMSVAPKVKDADHNVLPVIEQDMCSPTYDIPSSGTAAQLGPMDVSLHLINTVMLDDPKDDIQVTAKVSGLEFKNIFPPNGQAWSQDQIDENVDYPGELKATMDFRELAPLFNVLYHEDGSPPTAAEVCGQLPKTAACTACSDGNMSCLSARAIFLHAEDSPGMTVEPVDAASRPATCK